MFLHQITSKVKCYANSFSLANILFRQLSILLILFFLPFYSLGDINDNYEKALNSYQQKDYKASIIHLKNNLTINNEHVSSRVLLAKNYLALAQSFSAETQLINAQKNGAGNAVLSPLFAQAYLAQRKYDQVLDILTPRNNSVEFKSKMLAFRGLAYFGKGNLNAAQTEFTQALDLMPSNIDALLGQAKIAFKQDEILNALSLLQNVLSITPNNKHGLLMAAIAYDTNNQPEIALTTINQLLSIEPEHYNALLIRSSLLANLKRYDDALKDINVVTNSIPNEPLINYLKINTLNTLNAYDEASETQTHLAAIIKNIPEEVMNQQPIYYFVAGLANFKEGNYGLAERAFLSYNRLKPDDISAIKLLARTQMILGSNTQAKKHLMNAHFIDENNREVMSLLGRINILTGNIEKAEYFLNLVIKAEPSSLTAQTDIAKLYLFKGQYYKVIQLFSLAVDNEKYALSLTSEILFILATSYQETQQYAKAINITNKIILIEPNNSYAYQVHGSLSGLMKNYSQAKSSYLKSQALDENNFQAVIHLARFALAERKPEDAITLLKNQLEKGDNSALFIELGDVYGAINDEKNSALFYRKAQSLNPSSVLSLTKIINKHLEKNEIPEAITTVENYLRKYNDSAEVHELAASLYFKNNQQSQTLYSLTQAVKLSNKKGSSLLKLAKIQLQLTQRDAAINSLQRAISWEKEFAPAYFLLIAIYTEDKLEDKSLSLINRFQVIHKDASITERLKGELYWALGKVTTSKQHFKLSIAQAPSQQAVLGLYRIYRQEERFKEIHVLLSTWLKNNPSDLVASVSLAENYRQQGDLTNAQRFYQSLLIQSPNNIILLNNAAIIALELKQFDQAITLIDKAYENNKKNVNIIDTKAWIEAQRGNLNIALPLLREANTLDYQNAEVSYHLAVTLQGLNRKTEALPYLRSAVNSSQNFNEKAKAIDLLKEWN